MLDPHSLVQTLLLTVFSAWTPSSVRVRSSELLHRQDCLTLIICMYGEPEIHASQLFNSGCKNLSVVFYRIFTKALCFGELLRFTCIVSWSNVDTYLLLPNFFSRELHRVNVIHLVPPEFHFNTDYWRLGSYLSRRTRGWSWSAKVFMSSATLSLPEGANTLISTWTHQRI